MSLSPRLPRPGELVAGKYLVSAVLGGNEHCIAYEARQRLTHELVALRWTPVSADVNVGPREGREEASVAGFSQLRHPSVLELVEAVKEGGALCTVLEWHPGESLDARLRRLGPQPIAEVARLLLPCIRGVIAAHLAGIVQHAIKTTTLYVCAPTPNEPEQAKLLDFEVDPSRGQRLLAAGPRALVPAGTPQRLPEARAALLADPRNDVRAFGAIAYHALTGRPHSTLGDNAAAHELHPVPTPVLPPIVRWFIERALSEDCDRPFQTLDEMATALANMTSAMPQASERGAPSPVSPPGARPSATPTRSPIVQPPIVQPMAAPRSDPGVPSEADMTTARRAGRGPVTARQRRVPRHVSLGEPAPARGAAQREPAPSADQARASIPRDTIAAALDAHAATPRSSAQAWPSAPEPPALPTQAGSRPAPRAEAKPNAPSTAAAGGGATSSDAPALHAARTAFESSATPRGPQTVTARTPAGTSSVPRETLRGATRPRATLPGTPSARAATGRKPDSVDPFNTPSAAFPSREADTTLHPGLKRETLGGTAAHEPCADNITGPQRENRSGDSARGRSTSSHRPGPRQTHRGTPSPALDAERESSAPATSTSVSSNLQPAASAPKPGAQAPAFARRTLVGAGAFAAPAAPVANPRPPAPQVEPSQEAYAPAGSADETPAPVDTAARAAAESAMQPPPLAAADLAPANRESPHALAADVLPAPLRLGRGHGQGARYPLSQLPTQPLPRFRKLRELEQTMEIRPAGGPLSALWMAVDGYLTSVIGLGGRLLQARPLAYLAGALVLAAGILTFVLDPRYEPGPDETATDVSAVTRTGGSSGPRMLPAPAVIEPEPLPLQMPLRAASAADPPPLAPSRTISSPKLAHARTPSARSSAPARARELPNAYEDRLDVRKEPSARTPASSPHNAPEPKPARASGSEDALDGMNLL